MHTHTYIWQRNIEQHIFAPKITDTLNKSYTNTTLHRQHRHRQAQNCNTKLHCLYSVSINFRLRPYTAFSTRLLGGYDFSGGRRERTAELEELEEEENMAKQSIMFSNCDL